jgi:hypothetical protein
MITPPQTHFATIAIETKFFYPVKKGLVAAKAKFPSKMGGTCRAQQFFMTTMESAMKNPYFIK